MGENPYRIPNADQLSLEQSDVEAVRRRATELFTILRRGDTRAISAPEDLELLDGLKFLIDSDDMQASTHFLQTLHTQRPDALRRVAAELTTREKLLLETSWFFEQS